MVVSFQSRFSLPTFDSRCTEYSSWNQEVEKAYGGLVFHFQFLIFDVHKIKVRVKKSRMTYFRPIVHYDFQLFIKKFVKAWKKSGLACRGQKKTYRERAQKLFWE